ncbi:RNA polymerase subunit sigma-24, partial [Streptomyces sp. NPDC050804]
WLVGDSCGKAKAPLRVVEGVDKVARFFTGVAGDAALYESRTVEINGAVALLFLREGKPDLVLQLEIADGKVRAVHIVRNPDKLSGVTSERPAL